MKIPKIANAIGKIDDELITSAMRSAKGKGFKFRWGALAASFVAVILVASIGSLAFSDLLFIKTEIPNERYKKFSFETKHLATIWPWEYLSVTEKYLYSEIDGIEYACCSSTPINEDMIGDKIGKYDFWGYDDYKETSHTDTFEAYKINGINQDQFVAAKMDGKYYPFKNDTYSPPKNLGEFFKELDLPSLIELDKFAINNDENKLYTLNNDDHVWKVLKNCKSAKGILDEEIIYDFIIDEREHIMFSTVSEGRSFLNRPFAITEDGYLWTTIFDWEYIFNIGEDAAQEIIKYAKENSKKTTYESKTKTVYGEVVTITKDYVLVDDSSLCKDEKDGITYKIPLDDIRISRYFEHGDISIKNIVCIYYTEAIKKANGYVELKVTHIEEGDYQEGEITIYD